MKLHCIKSILNVICLLLFISLPAVYTSGQIKIKNKIHKDVPLKIEVENANSEKWVNELEIKVTNTGEKPIYYLYFLLVIDDVKNEEGVDIGFTFTFGDGRNYSRDELARPTDASIKPNQSHTFKINEKVAKRWEVGKSRNSFIEPKAAYFRLGWISFGDGTARDGAGKLLEKPNR